MSAPFHEGEIAVQERAGVRSMAERVGRSIGSSIQTVAQEFLRNSSFIIIATTDSSNRVWVSRIEGQPGFIEPIGDGSVRINSLPPESDPFLNNIEHNDQVGSIAIDFATRRRMRLNGRIRRDSSNSFLIDTEQVYANCPKYIQAREFTGTWDSGASRESLRSEALAWRHQMWIREADTFFIGSNHPEGGTDASHRGGLPGFVHVIDRNLVVWPDYSGNTMFQTLGNIAVNPKVGLLFPDFESGGTLQLTGEAKIVWDAPNQIEFPGAERLIEFHIAEVIETRNGLGGSWKFISYSSTNPA